MLFVLTQIWSLLLAQHQLDLLFINKFRKKLINIKHPKLTQFAFPSLFLVGLEITNNGLPRAFFLPDRQNGGLRQYIFPDVLR